MSDCRKVIWGKWVSKQLERLPDHIEDKFLAWVWEVQRHGLRQVRRISGYHDEPLQGERSGQRSIRLSRSYRAIYVETQDGAIEVAQVIEVNKHGY